MSYVAAVDHLHALTQELSPTAPRRKFDLAHMRILAAALGDPQKQFRSVLIAGTNGKGSTASTLAGILAASGLRTAIYTSPHLSRVTERIRTAEPNLPPCHSERSEEPPYLSLRTANLQPAPLSEIPEEAFARLYFRVDETALRLVSAGQLPHHPSFFESLTALAFLYFAERKVDIAILEVGMGGRLDATNIVDPMLSVITDIALDHQDYLGDTIAEIAREKAGILRQDGTLITLPQHPEANQAIGEAAIALNVRGINAADYLPGRDASINSVILSEPPENSVILSEPPQNSVILSERSESKDPERLSPASPLPHLSATSHFSPLTPNHYDLYLSNETLHVRSPLAGEHQRRNIALAIATAIELHNQYGYNITNSAIEAGTANTSWPGRLEFLPPNLLLDVAHNPAGAWTLRAAIATLPEPQPRTLIFSCLRDKDLTEMARILFPLFDSTGGRPHDHIVFAPIHNPRAASIDDLLHAAQALDVPAHPAQDATEALALARTLTPDQGLIIATGSIYLIGALRDAVLGSGS
jgi:dihydrofolate synthase / folylpolyglutamate synthase